MASRILIIDDDVDIQEVMSAILEGEGYEVHVASDGEEGLAKAEEIQPELILLDVMMTSQDEGFQTAYKLRAHPQLSEVPIVMITSVSKVTGFRFDKERDEEFLPVSDFVEKPVSRSKLLEVVRRHLEG